jgi:two-component system NarL family sensor kinase
VSGAAARAGAAGQPELAGSMEEAAAAVRTGINGLRSLLVDIYPPSLESTGLRQALTDLVEGFATHDVEVRLALRAEAEPDLDRAGRRLVFQVAQETARNAVRHSGAAAVDVVLEDIGYGVRLVVADDGVGFDAEQALAAPEHGHFGLRLLLDAARENGADLWVATAPGQGTSWCLEVRR